MGAVGGGKVLMWQENPMKKWCGAAAASMYKVLKGSLKTKGKKKKKTHTIVEDNDPTGYKSKKGEAAKAEEKLNVLALPKRSPDLNVLDYAVWADVNRRMRKQEKNWTAKKKESREQYLDRLRRTALGTCPKWLKKRMEDMPRRLGLLVKAKGGHFAEAK